MLAALIVAIPSLWLAVYPAASAVVDKRTDIWDRPNLVAWCAAPPWDAKDRSPEERARMLKRLGFKHFAYNWRPPAIPTFDAEIEALEKHGINLLGWALYGSDNPSTQLILDTFKRHNVHPQLWLMQSPKAQGAFPKTPEEQKQWVIDEAERIKSLVERAAPYGSKVHLYNHNGWFGRVENQLALIDRLKERGVTDVGIVYNFSHARDELHDDTKDFPALWEKMKAHVVAVNITGMRWEGQLVYPSQGDSELEMMRTIQDSGWKGPVGVIAEKGGDAQVTLRNYLTGLDWLAAELKRPGSGGPRPFQCAVEELKSDREKLPLFKTLSAAKISELTPVLDRSATYRRWSRSNADPANTRYSALSQINRDNVKELKVAWTYRSGDGNGNIQANPVIVDGVLFAPTAGKHIVAIHAETGKEIWRFRYPSTIASAYGPATRGLTYWEGNSHHPARLLFVANGYLTALDPRTGQLVASFGERGMAPSSKGPGRSAFLGAVAPVTYQDVVIIANQTRLDAFDVVTGAHRWKFDTLQYPVTDPEQDNGGNIWSGIALDAARGIVFAAVGDPHPNFVGIDRPGDNQHTNSILALDARTGRLIWSFQDIAHDLWDLDISAPPNLVTIERAGKHFDAVAQVTKQGNTLLLDRTSGKPIFPVRFRRAPVSKLRGERTAPYQLALELPEPFARQVFSLGDITRVTPAAHAHVLKQVEQSNYGWFEPFEEGRPTVFYGMHGGAEWTGAAFDPHERVLYVSSNELAAIITVSQVQRSALETDEVSGRGAQVFQAQCAVCHGARGEGKGMAPPLANLQERLTREAVSSILQTGKGAMPAIPLNHQDAVDLLVFLFPDGKAVDRSSQSADKLSFTFDGYNKLRDDRGYPGVKPPWGTLNAIDLDTGRIRWKVPLGEYAELTREGVPHTGTENFGGAMVTAGGLVFCAGTRDLKIRAFDQRDGRELWQYKLPYGGYAPPATYSVNGRQYIVIAATGGGKLGGEMGDAYVAFALPK